MHPLFARSFPDVPRINYACRISRGPSFFSFSDVGHAAIDTEGSDSGRLRRRRRAVGAGAGADRVQAAATVRRAVEVDAAAAAGQRAPRPRRAGIVGTGAIADGHAACGGFAGEGVAGAVGVAPADLPAAG